MPLFTEVSGDYAQMGKNVQRRSGMPIPIDFAGSDVSFLHLIYFFNNESIWCNCSGKPSWIVYFPLFIWSNYF